MSLAQTENQPYPSNEVIELYASRECCVLPRPTLIWELWNTHTKHIEEKNESQSSRYIYYTVTRQIARFEHFFLRERCSSKRKRIILDHYRSQKRILRVWIPLLYNFERDSFFEIRYPNTFLTRIPTKRIEHPTHRISKGFRTSEIRTLWEARTSNIIRSVFTIHRMIREKTTFSVDLMNLMNSMNRWNENESYLEDDDVCDKKSVRSDHFQRAKRGTSWAY